MSEEMDYTDQLGTDEAYENCVAILCYGEGETHMRVTTPYSAEWIEQIKTTIPSRSRGWSPVRRMWTFNTFPHVIDKVIAASVAQGWAVREEWADGRRRTTYPNGEVVEEQQGSLFDGF